MKNQITLQQYAEKIGATNAEKIEGPNGDFIQFLDAKGAKVNSIPCGKKSQGNALEEYKVLELEDGAFVATVNNYKVAGRMSFAPQKETVK